MANFDPDRNDLRLVDVLADGIVKVRCRGHVAVWSRSKLRKPVTCAATGKPLAVGEMAYRPVGNQMYRALRISADHLDHIIEMADQS